MQYGIIGLISGVYGLLGGSPARKMPPIRDGLDDLVSEMARLVGVHQRAQWQGLFPDQARAQMQSVSNGSAGIQTGGNIHVQAVMRGQADAHLMSEYAKAMAHVTHEELMKSSWKPAPESQEEKSLRLAREELDAFLRYEE